MELVDIARFFGLTKRKDFIDIIKSNGSNIKKEIYNNTSIEHFNVEYLALESLRSSNLVGFTASYPVELDSSSFKKERQSSKKYDFSFLNQILNEFFNISDARIGLISVQYDKKSSRIYYNFLAFGIDRNTNNVIQIIV